MKIRRASAWTLSAVLVGLLSIGVSSPAIAAEPEPDSLQLAVLEGDQWIPLDADEFRAATLHLESSSPDDSGNRSSRLIGWNQSFGCDVLNNENDVFATYWFPWDGRVNGVRLKCGTSSWGYKHIRERHESQWQATLDSARAHGWNSAAFGVNSWDDLMSGTTSAVVADPGLGLTHIAVSNKWCTKAMFGLWDTNYKRIVYDFGVETVWASDSDKLITSFPSNRKVC